MRIIIETDDIENVALKSQGETRLKQAEQEVEFIDGGAPSEELLMALDEASSVEIALELEEEVTDDAEESIVH